MTATLICHDRAVDGLGHQGIDYVATSILVRDAAMCALRRRGIGAGKSQHPLADGTTVHVIHVDAPNAAVAALVLAHRFEVRDVRDVTRSPEPAA